jgi:diadenosine tetraphosphatase ApaH/serine/threonine PP2A family protein phosphatase
MEITDDSTERERERWDFLAGLALRNVHEPFLLVHASPRAELSEYILPGDVKYAPNKLEDIFSKFAGHCTVGHTHMPCVITEDLRLTLPQGAATIIELGDKRAIVNIGSVGQPRDRDNRACYITLEDGTVRYHRVPYRFGRTMEKLTALGEKYEILAYRLALGR